MNPFTKWSVAGVAAIGLMAAPQFAAAQECDTIKLGAAISLTGKYATNGMHTQNGYEFAIIRDPEDQGERRRQGR